MSDTPTSLLASWELPDTLWKRMEALIPPQTSAVGAPRTVNLRQVTAGIF